MRNFVGNCVNVFSLIVSQLSFNEARKLSSNPPSWLTIFSVVCFNKILLFSIGLITFVISFISLFVSGILKPIADEIFLLRKLRPASKKTSLSVLALNLNF